MVGKNDTFYHPFSGGLDKDVLKIIGRSKARGLKFSELYLGV